MTLKSLRIVKESEITTVQHCYFVINLLHYIVYTALKGTQVGLYSSCPTGNSWEKNAYLLRL